MALLGALVGSLAFVVGCGDSVEEGSAAKFEPKADISRQDAMRNAMMKDKGSAPKGAKKAAPKEDQKTEEAPKDSEEK
jgi:hypothetical protein